LSTSASRDALAAALTYPLGDTLPATGAVQWLAPGVGWLRMPLPFALDHINLWLLRDGAGWTIVDSGVATAATQEAWEQIFARELQQFEDYIRHPGQEFALVLSGRVRIQFETGEEVSIGPQETAYFNSSVGHIYLAEGEEDAEVMVVMSER